MRRTEPVPVNCEFFMKRFEQKAGQTKRNETKRRHDDESIQYKYYIFPYELIT